MSFNIGSLVGFVQIDHSGVRPGMSAAEREIKAGMDRAGAVADKGGKDVGGRFSKGVTSVTSAGLKTLAAGVVAGFAVDKVVTFLSDANQAASDLQQTVMKSNVIFGSQAAAMETWADTASDAFGLSKSKALEAAAGFGDMLQQLGDTSDQAAKSSKSIVQMAADLGSFNNLETGDVLDRISASLRGEFDSLQAVIPNINAARVQTEAMTATGKASADQLTAQEKAHATLAIIQKDGAKAQGDFARSAGSFAIEQQKAAAKSEELSAKIGQQLLPIMTAFQTFMSDTILPGISGLIDGLVQLGHIVGELPGPVKGAVVALVAFHLLKGPLSSMLDATKTKVAGLGSTLKGAGIAGSAKAAGTALVSAFGGPLGIAVGAGAAALTFWAGEAQKVDTIANTLKDTIDKTSGSFTAQSKATVKEALFGDLSTEDIKRMQDLGVNFDALADAALKGGPALQAAQDGLDGLNDFDALFIKDDADIIDGLQSSLDRAGQAAERSRLLFGELPPEVEKTGDAAGDTAPKIKTLEEATTDVSEAAKTADQAHRDLATAILEVSGAAVSADQAEANWQQAIDDATKAIDENGKTVTKHKDALNLNTEAGRNNQDALIGLRDAAVDNAEAMLNNGDSVDTVKTKMGQAREEFIKVAEKMGLSKTAAEKLATEYGLTKESVDTLKGSMDKIPKEVKSKASVDTISAMANLAALQVQLALIKSKRIRVTTDFVTTGDVSLQAARNRSAIADIQDTSRFGGPIGPIPGYAHGTLIGPGTGTSDTMRAFVRETGKVLAVSNGEFLSTDSSRRRNHAALEAGNKGATLGVMQLGAGGGDGPQELSDTTIHKLAMAVARLRVVTDVDSIGAALVGGM